MTVALMELIQTDKQEAKRLLTASVCRHSFEEFVRRFWGQVPGTRKLVWNWHLSVFCKLLQEAAERVFEGLPKEEDVVINVSPGTSKSTLFSILFPAWVWTRMPYARILTASHTDELVLELSDKAREVIKSEKYREHFPEIELRKTADAKGKYANTLGGERTTCTVAGKSPTGRHSDFIIMDDPIDPKKVLSEKEREAAKHFLTNVVTTRKIEKAITVTFLVMQRLGVGDPTEVMLEAAKVEGAAKVRHICLPSNLLKGDDGAFLEGDVVPQELARHYIDGLMDPIRLGEKVLAEYKARGDHFFSTQFRQRPYTMSGGMFKSFYFNKRIQAAPYNAKRIRGWDRAATEDGGCATAGVLLAWDNENWYVEHVVHGHWEPTKRNQIMRATALMDRSRYGPSHEPKIYVEREGGSAGRDAWKGVAKALEGFPVFEQTVTGDKTTRAEPWSAQCAAGNVYMVADGTWDINGYIAEHCAFPNGVLKDRVDSSSMSFNLSLGMRRTGKGMRILTDKKEKGLRIIIGSKQALANVVIGNPSILLAFSDPSPIGNNELPIHGCDKLMDSLVVQCMDTSPEENQLTWNEPIPAYDQQIDGKWARKSAADLILTTEQGKKIWSMITKKRVEQYQILVIVDDDDRRASSAALAICETLMQPLPIMSKLQDEEWLAKKEDQPANRHIYATIKATRGMVL